MAEKQTTPTPEPPALAGTDANIHQRMLAVVAGIGYIPKTGTGPAEQGSYAFARVEVIKDTIRDQHVRQGVMCHQTIDESAYEVITGGNGKHAFVASVRGRLTFVNVDQPDDRVEESFAGMAVDYSDKAITKAITSGVKAALLGAYSIPTGADPDDAGPELPEGRAAQQARPAARPAQRSYGDQPPPPDDGGMYGPDGGPRGQAAPSGPGDRCPKHDRPWKSGQYGWYCSAKDDSEERGYCKQRPAKDWSAAHER